jgi:hypothetical protein
MRTLDEQLKHVLHLQVIAQRELFTVDEQNLRTSGDLLRSHLKGLENQIKTLELLKADYDQHKDDLIAIVSQKVGCDIGDIGYDVERHAWFSIDESCHVGNAYHTLSYLIEMWKRK